ncbi:DUF1998 domain-containing protein [Pleurocapsales cyanobacterium LEGE 10410]|nr:DUF1998 domain-containing protein [Pleurocapsales cyanobacterium LEGE 10410]
MTQRDFKKYKVGELRPSQILFTYGIGAIADLPNLAVMVMGLEEWEKNRTAELSEPRLLVAVRRRLGSQVKELRLPPMPSETAESPLDEAARIGIPVAPFPSWMVCPKCRLLAPLQSGLFELKHNPYRPNEARYVHTHCPRTRKPPAVIPARFLVACENGHLDDFPWRYFVHQGNSDCKGSLRLEEYGVSGAATDIVVNCNGCKSSRRLSDAFGEVGKNNLPACRGRHPHLRNFEDCDRQMKSILLGASNSWFSSTLSALSIPSAANQLEELVEQNWVTIGKANSQETLQVLLSALQATGQLQDFTSYPLEEIWATVAAKQQGIEETETDYQDLKTPEWQIFSEADSRKNTRDFQLHSVSAPVGYEKYFTQTVLIERLREVRALIGFTRIQSPGDFADIEQQNEECIAPLSRYKPKWLPATEIKGEGIFLQFNEDRLQAWEKLPAVKKHERQIRVAQKDWLNSRNRDLVDKVPFPGIRYVLLHSFSHALMRQLALECGYNVASLRERIYSQPPEAENGAQAGLLIYTAAPDSEGTLGGLVKLGEPQTLGYHIAQALQQMRLCASDPLCAEHKPHGGTYSLHWAACHACLFSPETSCERGNKFLDRSVLVSTVAIDNLAFFVT